jgi:hypothetical protein
MGGNGERVGEELRRADVGARKPSRYAAALRVEEADHTVRGRGWAAQRLAA